MKDLEAQLADMKLDRLISATHSQLLKTNDPLAAYTAELLHRLPRLRDRNRELQQQLNRANHPRPGMSADRLRKKVREATRSQRAICNHLDALANEIR